MNCDRFQPTARADQNPHANSEQAYFADRDKIRKLEKEVEELKKKRKH